jgi:hypothetical protein
MEYKKEILITEKKYWIKTIISFLVFILLIIAAVFSWKKIQTQPKIADRPATIRKVLDFNGNFFSNFLSDEHLAKSYPVSAAVARVRVNGDVGMANDFDPAGWKLQVIKSPGDTLFVTLDDIKSLPKTDVIFDFKCIEGWSQVTHWAGARFSDFIKKYHLNTQSQMKYVGLATPDKKYYVGIDMASMMHPQTILCYEMNGKPLPMNQGYPLRLIIPVKYGIKHLKRIGSIYFSNSRPPDYWYERGYDYFAGL